VVELAYVRDRIDRGFGDERVFALQNEEAYWVHMARAARRRCSRWPGTAHQELVGGPQERRLPQQPKVSSSTAEG